MSDSLEDALRREAQRMTPAEVPAGMERRICAAIERAERPEPAVRPYRAWAYGLGGLAAAATALVLVLRPAAPRGGPADSADAAQLAQAVQALPGQVWDQMQPKLDAALGRDPLGQEKAALASDARSALRFLAFNFLPDPPRPEIRQG
ncbi:MAG TPA: hypothetical protein VHC86_02555 [Opitutaceae bacterium]|nr:hypothetical protein [Opitutaceae bacterium]